MSYLIDSAHIELYFTMLLAVLVFSSVCKLIIRPPFPLSAYFVMGITFLGVLTTEFILILRGFLFQTYFDVFFIHFLALSAVIGATTIFYLQRVKSMIIEKTSRWIIIYLLFSLLSCFIGFLIFAMGLACFMFNSSYFSI